MQPHGEWPPQQPTGYGYPQQWPVDWPPAPKPGIVRLRPMGLSDMLDGAMSMMVKYPRVVFPPAAIAAVITGIAGAVLRFQSRHEVDGEFGAWSVLALLVSAVAALLAGSILSGVLAHAVAEAVLGRTPTLRAAWAKARPQIGRLAALSILAVLIVVVGLILLIAPGVWMYGLLAVAAPALALENLGARAAIRRSADLVKGRFWRTVGLLLLTLLIVSSAAGLVSGLASFAVAIADHSYEAGHVQSGWAIVVIQALTAVASTVTAPFTVGMTVLIYLDLRMRKENLHLVLQQASGTAPPPASPMPPRWY